MRHFIIVFLLSLCTITYAQDVIVTNDAETIKAYNVDCSPKYAYYQLTAEASAPIHRIALSEIIAIRFADGSKYVPSENPIEAKRAAALDLVSSAFSNNSGSYRGNAGLGEYDLGGRGIIGTLPRPVYNVSASGTVVVKITVNEEGQVVKAEPATGTTISNQKLRQAAVDAAKKARFAASPGAGNATGKITYYFDSND